MSIETFIEKYPVLIDIATLSEEKDADYNHASIELEDYFPFGQVSYTQMIYTKALRLRALTERLENDEPNFESIEDSLKDLINYCLYNLKAMEA